MQEAGELESDVVFDMAQDQHSVTADGVAEDVATVFLERGQDEPEDTKYSAIRAAMQRAAEAGASATS